MPGGRLRGSARRRQAGIGANDLSIAHEVALLTRRSVESGELQGCAGAQVECDAVMVSALISSSIICQRWFRVQDRSYPTRTKSAARRATCRLIVESPTSVWPAVFIGAMPGLRWRPAGSLSASFDLPSQLLRRNQPVTLFDDRLDLSPIRVVIDAHADPALGPHVRRDKELVRRA